MSSHHRLSHIQGIQDSLHFAWSCLQISTVMHLKENYFLYAQNPKLHANYTNVVVNNLYSDAP